MPSHSVASARQSNWDHSARGQKGYVAHCTGFTAWMEHLELARKMHALPVPVSNRWELHSTTLL
jgi:hypothetical protein